jgi:hypothetical protein
VQEICISRQSNTSSNGDSAAPEAEMKMRRSPMGGRKEEGGACFNLYASQSQLQMQQFCRKVFALSILKGVESFSNNSCCLSSNFALC